MKIRNHTKYKQTNVPSYLPIFDWILIKQIIVPSTTFVFLETGFQKILPGVLSGELGMSKNA